MEWRFMFCSVFLIYVMVAPGQPHNGSVLQRTQNPFMKGLSLPLPNPPKVISPAVSMPKKLFPDPCLVRSFGGDWENGTGGIRIC